MPIVLLLFMGIMEYCRYMLLIHVATSAARVGARTAVVNCTTQSNVTLGTMADTQATNPPTIRGIVNGQMCGLQGGINDPARPYAVFCFQAGTSNAAYVGYPLNGTIPAIPAFAVPQYTNTVGNLTNSDDWKNAPFGQAVSVVVYGKFIPIIPGIVGLLPPEFKVEVMMNSEGGS